VLERGVLMPLRLALVLRSLGGGGFLALCCTTNNLASFAVWECAATIGAALKNNAVTWVDGALSACGKRAVFERVVRASVGRVPAGVSHSDYHIWWILAGKTKPGNRPGLAMPLPWVCIYQKILQSSPGHSESQQGSHPFFCVLHHFGLSIASVFLHTPFCLR
jgi:hypothetical protein